MKLTFTPILDDHVDATAAQAGEGTSAAYRTLVASAVVFGICGVVLTFGMKPPPQAFGRTIGLDLIIPYATIFLVDGTARAYRRWRAWRRGGSPRPRRQALLTNVTAWMFFIACIAFTIVMGGKEWLEAFPGAAASFAARLLPHAVWIGLYAAWVLGAHVIQQREWMAGCRRFAEHQRELRIELTHDAFVFEDGMWTARTPWHTFTRMTETPGAFVLHESTGQVQRLPKRAAGSDEAVAALREFLHAVVTRRETAFPVIPVATPIDPAAKDGENPPSAQPGGEQA